MASPSDLTGTELGQYKILRRIGRGGMGAVYEATHRRIGKRVALKVLHAEHAEDPETLQRFLNEARAVNEVGHQNIVDIADMGDDEHGKVFLVMELLTGTTLRVEMAGERLSPERAAGIALQICDALAATHAVGIVHRDLKPENVFLRWKLGRPDFVTLVDFGIAKLGHGADLKTRTGTMMGTPQYMSPEQTEGGRNIDGRTDIYALGVMLYEMLSGKAPFEGETVPIILRKIWMETPVPVAMLRPDLPAGLADAVMKAFARDPGQRFQTVQELKAALLEAVPDTKIVAAWKAMAEAAPEKAAAGAAESIGLATADTFQSGAGARALPAAFMATTPAPAKGPRPRTRLAALMATLVVGGVGIGVALVLALQEQEGHSEAAAGEDGEGEDDRDAPESAAAADTAAPGGAGAGLAPESAVAPATAAAIGPAPAGATGAPAAGPATGTGAAAPVSRGEPRLPLDPLVLRSHLLKKDGKRLSRCFTEHDGMDSARFELDVSASGRVEHVRFTYLGAIDFTHQTELKACLEPLLKAARFPPIEPPGTAELVFSKDDMVSRPVHLDLPKMSPVAMEELVRKKHRERFEPCFAELADIKYVLFSVRLDGDGKVVDVDRRGYHGSKAEEFSACATPHIKAIPYPKTRAGGRFEVELRRKPAETAAPEPAPSEG